MGACFISLDTRNVTCINQWIMEMGSQRFLSLMKGHCPSSWIRLEWGQMLTEMVPSSKCFLAQPILHFLRLWHYHFIYCIALLTILFWVVTFSKHIEMIRLIRCRPQLTVVYGAVGWQTESVTGVPKTASILKKRYTFWLDISSFAKYD